ncbi:MAG: hypothetical protein AB8B86_05670 [Pseudomonadales bacterium]
MPLTPPIVFCRVGADGVSQAAVDVALSFAVMNLSPFVLLEMTSEQCEAKAVGNLNETLHQLRDYGVDRIAAYIEPGCSLKMDEVVDLDIIDIDQLSDIHCKASSILSF